MRNYMQSINSEIVHTFSPISLLLFANFSQSLPQVIFQFGFCTLVNTGNHTIIFVTVYSTFSGPSLKTYAITISTLIIGADNKSTSDLYKTLS